MKKQLVALGIIGILIAISISGCLENKDINGNENKIIYIRGILDRNDNIDFKNIYIYENRSIIIPQKSGNYSIQLLDNMNQVIDEYSFEPIFELIADPIGIIETNVSGFIYSLPYKEGIKKIVIKHGEVVIAERLISDNAPTVHYHTNPLLYIDENYNITWNANDVDGDTLYFSLDYSPDNGKTWILLQLESTNEFYLWNTTGLTPGSDYMIRIIANDGFHTETIISEAFSLNNCSCNPKGDDSEGYLMKICEYLKENADHIITGMNPDDYSILRIEDGQYDGREVLIILLDCCYMGDLAYIDKETGEVIGFSVGDL